MGIAAAQLRLIYLTLHKTDLEYKIMLISQTRMGLSNSVNDILNVGTDLNPDSPEFKILEQRKQRLQLIDKKLENQLTRYQSKLNMVSTEIESVQQMLNNNIKRAFSYGQ